MSSEQQPSAASVNDWIADESPLIDDPLLECLMHLARHHHRPRTRENLTDGLPLVNGKLTPSLLPRAAKRAGLYAKLVRRDPTQIPTPLLPCLLLLRNNWACLLMGWTEDGQAKLIFPGTGNDIIKLTRDELMKLYTGVAIYVRPKFRFDARAPELRDAKSRHWFWSVIMDSRHLYRDVFVLAFLINMLALAMPMFTMNVYDRVVPNKAFETLWVLALGALLVLGFDFLLRNLRAYVLELANKRIDSRLSALMMERILGLRMEVRPSSVGSFANNVRAFEGVREFVASASITTFIDVPFAIIFLTVITIIGWPMVLPVLIAILLIIGHAFWAQMRLQELSESILRASSQRNATLIETLTGLETIKVLNAASTMQQRWEQSSNFISHVNGRMRLVTQSTMSFTGLVQQLTSIAVLIVGVYLLAEGEATQGGLIAAVMLSSRALSPMAQVASLLTQFQNTKTSLGSLEQTMALPVERPADANFLSRSRFEGNIEFREVSFAYPGRDQPSIQRVSFTIRRGERVGIIGRIGAGKTTLERLILGLYQPTEGTVLVDGVDMRQLDPAELRRAIGYVPQDPMLFYGSLRDNITMGVLEASDRAVLQAAEIAGVNEFADRHPKGYEMLIGERGESLSAGQRQAIAIARAVLVKPPILLLDEPTSAMDFVSEDRLKARLKPVLENRTVILITHRTALLDYVDRLLVLDNGKLVADGPRDQVMSALREGKIRGAT